MGKTEENLAKAFAGESQANRRYLAFARKAEDEGYESVARLFRAAAESETVHALNHFRTMDGIKGTLENLRAAKGGEDYEKTEMYPEFIEATKEEGEKEAERSFSWAIEAEKVHSELYGRAIDALESGKRLEMDVLHICRGCGFTVEGEPPEKCPVCGAPREMFRKVE